MSKTTMLFLLASLVFAMPAFAQGGQAASGTNWAVAAACIGMAIASGLCGLGQGRATGSAAEALARNPAARPGIQFALILGLALIESLALYTLVIIFAKVK
jgi:F-type H+-transporting ATPase subunit c